MESLSSIKIKKPFESYFLTAFERLSAFFSEKSPKTNCFRIFNGFQDSIPSTLKGLSIDLYDQTLLIQTNQSTELPPDLISLILKNIPEHISVILKNRFSEKGLFLSKTSVLRGFLANDPFWVVENNRRYLVQIHDKLDTGLYLDTALVRDWLFQNAKSKKILNLYSYTCSYGVAAMLGGALDTVHVDSSRSALQVGKSNYEANQIPINNRSFNHLLVNDFLRFARKRKDSYDTIIIDPSPPTNSIRTPEEIINFYGNPIQKCLGLLKPSGQILVSCHNFNEFTPNQLCEALIQKAGNMICEQVLYYPIEYAIQTPKMFVFKKLD